jgi:hypothetical protein
MQINSGISGDSGYKTGLKYKIACIRLEMNKTGGPNQKYAPTPIAKDKPIDCEMDFSQLNIS